MDTLQAAVLNVKLRHLEKWNTARRDAAARYDSMLDGLGLILPRAEAENHVYHLYVIRTQQRAELQDHLKANGIDSGIHYPVPLQDTAAEALVRR